VLLALVLLPVPVVLPVLELELELELELVLAPGLRPESLGRAQQGVWALPLEPVRVPVPPMARLRDLGRVRLPRPPELPLPKRALPDLLCLPGRFPP